MPDDHPFLPAPLLGRLYQISGSVSAHSEVAANSPDDKTAIQEVEASYQAGTIKFFIVFENLGAIRSRPSCSCRSPSTSSARRKTRSPRSPVFVRAEFFRSPA